MADDENVDKPKPSTAKEVQKRTNLIPGKGKPKGGTRFPRIALDQALKYSTKLVSKTAVAPQTEATILAGVFGNSGSAGKVRASALKQYGLLEGTSKAYAASQLAKDIDAAADDDERLPLIRRAMRSPKVFRDLFDTYHGDEASKGKIRSRTQQLEVHPESGDECAELFIASAEIAKLGTRVGDGIRLVAATDAAFAEPETPQELAEETEGFGADSTEETETDLNRKVTLSPPTDGRGTEERPRPRTAADVSVNLTVDSSIDVDKLGKQLELLRRFGLI